MRTRIQLSTTDTAGRHDWLDGPEDVQGLYDDLDASKWVWATDEVGTLTLVNPRHIVRVTMKTSE